MEIVSLMGGLFSTYVFNPIAAKFQVSRKLEDNIKELEMSRDNLVARKDGERGKLEEAKRQEGVEESPEAKLWFTRVDGALSDVNNLLSDFTSLQNHRFRNFFFWSRFQLSKRALKHKQIVDKLYEAEPKSGWTAASSALPKGKKLDTISIEGQPTTEKLRRQIIDAVLDDRYVVVGLHGMGGVGKTTLLRHAYEHFRQSNGFESVIFVTVSGTPNFVEIRKQVAQSLGLTNCQNDNKVKEFLCRQTGKYLLILDDMWKPVDLGEICILAPTKENGCKILMASRSKSVVTKFVTPFAARDSLQPIQVSSLRPEEAWNLFVQKVGMVAISKPEIEPLAKEVLKKCDGLPLAIIVIGGTMSTRETVGEWRDAVRELEHCASNFDGVEEEVFPILMFSFEKLEPIEQSLFLYCCLFPEDCIITKEAFVNFAIGEKTLCDEMHKLGDMRDKIDVLLGKLRNSSMLEDVGDGCVKMHDVVRELGLWITSPPTSNKYQYSKYIASRVGITEAPGASEWTKATKVSLWDSKIESLPQLPHECPQLHTLLLGTSSTKEFPRSFLEHMPALQILEMGCTRVETLPDTISHLVNLRLLRLDRCHCLQELPPEIAKLVQLILLDLHSCPKLRKLPVEMKKLHNLRFLDISDTEKLKRIPRGVLSGLHKLEELKTEGSGIKWDTSGLEELSQLTRLTSIDIWEIKRVTVSHWFKPLANKFMPNLCLRNCVTIDPLALPDLLEDSPNFCREVRFSSCKGLTRVPTCGCTWLIVQDCPDLKALLIVEEVKRNAFESLHRLTLDRLVQLETICIGIPQPEYGCFTNMEEITIKACPNLKELFTKGVTRLLKKLRLLRLCRCSQLVKLVSDDEDLEIDAFPSLKEICLCELPELTSICHLNLNWPSLPRAHIYLCPNLRRPLFGAQHADMSLNDELDSWKTQYYLYEKRREEEEENADNDDDDDDEEEDEEGEEEEEEGEEEEEERRRKRRRRT